MSCTTTTTLLPGQCINPLDWLLSKFTEEIENISPEERLDTFLNSGLYIPSCNFCCPCPGQGYILASVETYLKFIEVLYNFAAAPPRIPATCCSDFLKNIKDIEDCLFEKDIESIDRFLDKGVVEAGLINGESQLNKIYEWVLSILPSSSGSSPLEIIDRFLDKGLVIWCDKKETGDGYIFFGTVETFLIIDYFFSSSNPEELKNSCCTNVYASIETYLKYSDFFPIPGGGGGVPV